MVVVVANSSGGGGGKQWCMVVPGVKWAPNCLGCQKKPWVLNLSPARRLPKATYYINNCQFVSSLYNLMEIFRVGIVGTECWRMRVGGKRRSRGLSGHRQRTVHTTLSNFASVHTQVTAGSTPCPTLPLLRQGGIWVTTLII